MTFDHGSHNADIIRDANFLASKLGKVLHWLWLTVSSNNDLNIFGEVFGKPKGNVAFFSIIPIHEVIYSFEDKYDFVVKDI